MSQKKVSATIQVTAVIDGENGVSITSANVFYALSDQGPTGTPPANAAFTYDDFPNGNLTPGMYVWQATVVTFSDSKTEVMGKMCLGATTDFLQGTEVYATSQSGTNPPDDGPTNWKTTYTRQKGYYLWTATRVTYTDDTVAYLSKKCVGYWGEDGDDAVNYDIVFTEAWAKATPEGVISARLRGHAYKIEGSNRTLLNRAIIRYGYNPDDNDTYTDITTDSQGYFDADTWFDGDELDDSAKGSAVVFASIIIASKAVCTKYVTIVQEAAEGKAGHVGRWYYYAGDWQPGATHTMQETQAPFVKRGDNFYMLDYGTSNVKTGTTQLDPASNYNPVSGQGSKPWTLMQSTMQYYIAQAFFGPYAHFGSFIINGDWMLSQYGTLIDSSGTKTIVDTTNVNRQYNGKVPYAWFDPADPTAVSNPQSGSYKFIPNFAVDGLTGKTYQNDAYVRGEIHATSGEFRGVVRATNFFHSVAISGSYTVGFCNNDFLDQYSDEPWIGNFTYGGYYTEEEARQLSGENVGIDSMVKCTGAADIVVIKATANDTGDVTVTLPRAQDYEGKIVEIVDTRYTQPSSQYYVGSLYVRQCDNASCMKVNFTQSISIPDRLTLNGNYEHHGGSYRLMSYKEGGNYYWVKLGTS